MGFDTPIKIFSCLSQMFPWSFWPMGLGRMGYLPFTMQMVSGMDRQFSHFNSIPWN
jgi:hypothetical protein